MAATFDVTDRLRSPRIIARIAGSLIGDLRKTPTGKVCNPMSAALAVGPDERLSELARPDHELVELALVLPRWQVEALAAAARGRGLTAGQVLRRLIGGYCASLAADGR
jgi:hypothetical protein